MSRRSARNRKKRKFFEGETEVNATGRRRTKIKFKIEDMSTWDQQITPKHGNCVGERWVRVETSRRLKPIIQEALRQQKVAQEMRSQSLKLRKQLEKNNIVLGNAIKRIQYLSGHLRKCRLKLKQVNQSIELSRADADRLRLQIKTINTSRDRASRRLAAVAKSNEDEKVCSIGMSISLTR